MKRFNPDADVVVYVPEGSSSCDTYRGMVS